MELRVATLGLQDENMDLTQEAARLKTRLHKKQTMVLNSSFYYAVDDQIPHCSGCWKGNDKAIHLL